MEKVKFIYMQRGIRPLQRENLFSIFQILICALLSIFVLLIFTAQKQASIEITKTQFFVSILSIIYSMILMIWLLMSIIKNTLTLKRLKKEKNFQKEILKRGYLNYNLLSNTYFVFIEILKFVLVIFSTLVTTSVLLEFFYGLELYATNIMFYYPLSMLISLTVIKLINSVLNTRRLGIKQDK